MEIPSRQGENIEEGPCALATPSFTHLHTHTEFSMLDGAARVNDVVAGSGGRRSAGARHHRPRQHVRRPRFLCRVPGRGDQADHRHRGLHGGRVAARAAGAAGPKVDDTGGEGERRREALLPPDPAGGDHRGLPEPHEALLGRLPRGLLLQAPGRLGAARTAPRGAHRHHRLPRRRGPPGAAGRRLSKAEALAARLQDIFGRDNLFVELQDHGLAEQRKTNPALVEIARRIGAPLLATNDSHYTHREDAVAHDALLCVQTGATIDDPKRFKFEGEEHYLKTAAEMRHLFAELPEACDNTLWIAERADVEIEFGKPKLPGSGPRASAARLRASGRRLPAPPDHRGGRAALRRPAARRGDRAASSTSSGSSRNGVLRLLPRGVGPDPPRPGQRDPGRPGPGSAAGCCVAYCLRIVDLDPIRYDLLFERFLNPGRKQMPDIDMDFDERYRGEMIRYAAERYGWDHVAQIVTFSTIKARAAVRDAARVLGLPLRVGDRIAKAMPPLVMGRDTPLGPASSRTAGHEDGYKAAAELRDMYAADPDAKQVIDVAKGLEGLRRQDGIHAAAVVITARAADRVPARSSASPSPATTRGRADRHPVRDARGGGARPAEDGLPRAAQPLGHRDGPST